ncbi:MAG: helix-turn-helix domain-containing protein [Acidimicrobiales bacterium]
MARYGGAHRWPNSKATLISCQEEFVPVSLKALARKVRKRLGATQEGFAHELGTAGSTVGNWESGRKRPSPKHLRRMAELCPEFSDEIRGEIESYEWHRGKSGESGSDPLVDGLPAEFRAPLEKLARKKGLDISLIVRQALAAGITSLSSTQSLKGSDLRALAERQAKMAKEVYERTIGQTKAKRQHRHHEVA